MKIFFDTEFTGLTSAPRLLSIGLVAENDAALYIEFTDGWTEAQCSPWVRANVMPMLGCGERLTRRDAGARIFAWLLLFESPPTLLGETTWDTELFAELARECRFESGLIQLRALSFQDKAQANAFEAARQLYFSAQQASQHHALADARAFRAAWDVVFRGKEFN